MKQIVCVIRISFKWYIDTYSNPTVSCKYKKSFLYIFCRSLPHPFAFAIDVRSMIFIYTANYKSIDTKIHPNSNSFPTLFVYLLIRKIENHECIYTIYLVFHKTCCNVF